MVYNSYPSPLGKLLLAADDVGLTGIWFDKAPPTQEENLPIFDRTKHWLDLYFSGQKPDFSVPVHLIGSTFQLSVWHILQKIPYGKTVTYGEIAKQLSPNMSAQAVGGAVGKNPVSILVPCHRVIGARGNLTGYAGGLDRKIALLEYEGFDMTQFYLP